VREAHLRVGYPDRHEREVLGNCEDVAIPALLRDFEREDVTQQATLEVARADFDVLRYRARVGLAEDNYVRHKDLVLQTESRFRAGVGRGANVEQANARPALAASNRTTEVANLHDVWARYQRVVGELPPPARPMPSGLVTGIPASAGEAMEAALARNPAVSAAVEPLRATRATVSASWPATVEVSFDQAYTSDDYRARFAKVPVWGRNGGQWLISSEPTP